MLVHRKVTPLPSPPSNLQVESPTRLPLDFHASYISSSSVENCTIVILFLAQKQATRAKKGQSKTNIIHVSHFDSTTGLRILILLLSDLLLKFPQQSILGIFINLWFVFDILRTVCISVVNKQHNKTYM